MTTPDIAGLCERLLDNARYASESEMQAQIRRLAARTEAADTLERQAAEIERLRDLLVQADLTIRSFPGADQGHVEFIRAALTGEEN